MYCKVHYRVASSPKDQQQQELLSDQLILNLQTIEPLGATSLTSAGSTASAGAPQLNQSQPAQPIQLKQLNQLRVQTTQLIPLATVLDSAQGDATWFASPRNAQRLLESEHRPKRELELVEAETGSPLLYRAVGCNRARKCCCTCTRLCAHRCLHDCFVRLWLWKRELDSLGIATSRADEHDQAGQKLVSAASPYFATQCAVLNVYTSYKQLSQVIGSTISARMNTHIQEARARGGINLNSMDYSMQLKLNAKGKPIADPETGRLEVLYWPQSGLCPFCLPDRSYQLKKRMKKVGMPK